MSTIGDIRKVRSDAANAPFAGMRDPVQTGTMTASKYAGAIGLIVAICMFAYIALTGEPRLPIGIANGVYANRCCGRIVLTDGIMAVANRRIGYVVEEDQEGAYVLPDVYVGASNTALVIRPEAFPFMMRLDDPSRPRSIELFDDRAGDFKSYPFERATGS